MNTSARFWAKVDRSGRCWLWTAYRNKNGYGQFGVGPGRRLALAHRVSWELSIGPIPYGLGVLHRCDTPACVNPSHLFLGTQADNMRDCSAKGRTGARPLRGETIGNAKLTEPLVREIRRLAAQRVRQRDIATAVGVSQMAVWNVIHGVTWKHVAESTAP